jgi:filamentous hemagglutinin family protein
VFAAPPTPTTLPTGGNVVAGQASINQAGAAMTINQASSQAILNWQSFSIGSGASVNFVQPGASAVALNRVLGSDPSAIYGSLTANGQVFLVNPNGVLFGPGARVDVGGLVASTLNIRDADFLARNYRFSRDGAVGTVVNAGDLKGQYVALLAPEVRNEGVIVASMGTVALAAGDAVTLGISGQRLVDVQVDKASVNTLVENRHLIRAEEGTVILSAQSAHTLLGRVVNSSAVEANGISTDGGTVRLLASSTIDHSGSISANGSANGSGGSVILLADLANPASRTTVSGSISARGGSASGDGGFVETSASRLSIADSARIDTTAPNGRGGLWLLDPTDFTIALSGGDITGATLGTNLATTDVTIETSAAGGGNGDMFVNASVTWASAKTLTMKAHRNINVNSEINVNGTGTLLLNYDTANGGGDYFVRAPINLVAGSTFQTKRENDATITYTIIRTDGQLAAVGAGLAGNYVLGTNIDASVVASWTPLGDNTTPFTGRFDGLGHTVDGVTRPNTDNATTGIGLFGRSDGVIRNVGVTNVNVAGAQNVGGLAGINGGQIFNSYSSGIVTGSDKDNGAFDVGSIGGLVGQNSGNINSSYSSAAVKASTGTVPAGHSAGTQDMGGNPMSFTQGGIGGLAGTSQSPIADSYATGQVDGEFNVGGLVGASQGAISTSYSRGAVNGGTRVGGLVGHLFEVGPPLLTDTFWDTTTSGQGTSAAGAAMSTGLITADMKVKNNFTNFRFEDHPADPIWIIRENSSYPLLLSMLPPLFVKPNDQTKVYDGAVFGGAHAVAFSTPTNGKTAGAAGFAGAGTTGINAAIYGLTANGITLASDTDQHGFRDITFLAGTVTITPKAVNLTAPAATKVYNGNTAYTASAGDLAALSAMLGVGADTVTGITLTYDTATAGAGNKTLTPSAATVSSAAGNYNITFVPIATASITPKPVTLTPQAATKVFDGTTNYTATAGDLAVLSAQLGVGGETVTAITLTFNSAAVGTNKTLTPSAAVVSTANGNYNITFADNATSSITAVVAPPAPPAPTPTTTPAADPAVQTRTTLPVASGNFLVTFVPPHSVDSADTELVDAGTGQTVRSVRLALPGNAVSGKSSVIPPGGLIAMLRTASRSDNSLSNAPQYTQTSGTNSYPVLVPANSNPNNPRLSADENIPAANVAAGSAMTVKLPDSTFHHTDANAVVTLAASDLPVWMQFDAATGTFTGTPPAGFAGPLNIKVTATDNLGQSVDATILIRASAGGDGAAEVVGGAGGGAAGGAARRTAAGTGASRERAEIRATATGGSRREAIGTGRIGGTSAGGGRLGTSTRGAETGGRLGAGGRLGTGAVPGRGGSAGTGGESDRRQR